MTEPSTEAFNDFLAAHLPKQVEILWEDVFSPEELAPMPPMDGPWACWPGTDIKLCSRPVKFKTNEALRKFFLSGKDHTGQYDVCVMRWPMFVVCLGVGLFWLWDVWQEHLAHEKELKGNYKFRE